jgi:hypothetical protein
MSQPLRVPLIDPSTVSPPGHRAQLKPTLPN